MSCFFFLYRTDAEFIPSTTTDPKSIIRYGNSSYLFIRTKMNWEDARENCKRDQFDLSSILDPYSHSFLWLKILKYGVPIWIGLNSNVVRTSNYLSVLLLFLWEKLENAKSYYIFIFLTYKLISWS